jgi:hypothetical protein
MGLFTDRLEVNARNEEPLLGMSEDEVFELLSLRRAGSVTPPDIGIWQNGRCAR